jgi:1,2-diacylglycerol-3-alpha-glucose alpha-1,2-glucosyltransferase
MALLRNIPVIISVLNIETSQGGSMIIKQDGKLTLLLAHQTLINEATLVIVPSESGKTVLRHLGVTTPIEVLSEGMDFSRFESSLPLDKAIFQRYFRYDPTRKLVIGRGPYSYQGGLYDFIKIAKLIPQADFYYFGTKPIYWPLLLLMRPLRNLPANVHLKGNIDEEVYRSGLLNATAFLLCGHKVIGTTTLLDPMAAKTQIIAREGIVFHDLLSNGKTAFFAKDNDTLVKKVTDFMDEKIISTTEKAYQKAKLFDIVIVSSRLKNIYESLVTSSGKK